MLKTVEKFLTKYDLLNSDKSYLVGFSGGADSLCLLDILNSICQNHNIKLVAMHVNHNWRGEESHKEMDFCKSFCEQNGIDFLSTTLEGVKHSELAAREARQEFFKECAEQYKNPVIFTGHSATDNAETLIYRIAKGTGIPGLCGILPKQEMNGLVFYRPLLQFSRNDNFNYCKERNLDFNTDSSNSDVKYKRNFIRHEIMPKFREINENSEKALNQLSNLAKNEECIVNEYLQLIYKEIREEDKFKTKKFLNLSFSLQLKIIYNEFLKNNIDYDYSKILGVLNFIEENSNKKSGTRCSITTDLWLFVSSREFYFINDLQGKTTQSVDITQEGSYDIGGMTFTIEKYIGKVEKFPKETEDIAYVDLSAFKKSSLTLRTRQNGDIITPFGMQGSMKLKKYFNSKKIPQHEKDSLALLCSGNEVLWVIGVGLSEKIKVVQNPTHVIKLIK